MAKQQHEKHVIQRQPLARGQCVKKIVVDGWTMTAVDKTEKLGFQLLQSESATRIRYAVLPAMTGRTI